MFVENVGPVVESNSHLWFGAARNALNLPSKWVSVIAVARSIIVPTGYIAFSIPRAPETLRSPVTVVFPVTVSSPPTSTLAVVAKPVVTLLDEMVWGVVLLPLLVTEARVVVVSNSMFPTDSVFPTSTLLILIVEFFTCKMLSADSIDIYYRGRNDLPGEKL